MTISVYNSNEFQIYFGFCLQNQHTEALSIIDNQISQISFKIAKCTVRQKSILRFALYEVKWVLFR